MAWVYLGIAGLFEVLWVATMKLSEGFTKPLPSVATILAMCGSMWFLSIAIRTLPLGAAYTIWTGIGAVGSVILGIVYFGESREFMKIFFVCMIVAGIIGLKFNTQSN